MHITTRGGSKTQKKYVKSMADFCGEMLLGSRLYPKIELTFCTFLIYEEKFVFFEWVIYSEKIKME